MESEAEKEYAAFEEKMKRTVYFDNLSPQVTDPIMRTALGQYGLVTKVQFIPNYTEPNYTAKCALVEMENDKQALEIVETVTGHPFMISGMPRPVRACPAEPGMFEDRPAKPGATKQWYWLDPNDPDFKVGLKLKALRKKHSAEISFLLQKQLEEEQKLSKQQDGNLKAHYQKIEMLNSVFKDGSAQRLARPYRMNLGENSEFD